MLVDQLNFDIDFFHASDTRGDIKTTGLIAEIFWRDLGIFQFDIAGYGVSQNIGEKGGQNVFSVLLPENALERKVVGYANLKPCGVKRVQGGFPLPVCIFS